MDSEDVYKDACGRVLTGMKAMGVDLSPYPPVGSLAHIAGLVLLLLNHPVDIFRRIGRETSVNKLNVMLYKYADRYPIELVHFYNPQECENGDVIRYLKDSHYVSTTCCSEKGVVYCALSIMYDGVFDTTCHVETWVTKEMWKHVREIQKECLKMTEKDCEEYLMCLKDLTNRAENKYIGD